MSESPFAPMLAFLETEPREHVQDDALRQFGRGISEAPDEGAQLLAEIASIDATGPHEERLSVLFTSALDEARMAMENGQARGRAFIAAVEDRLAHASREDELTLIGSFALSGCWVRAGLTPPESLCVNDRRLAEAASAAAEDFESGEPAHVEGLFDSVFSDMIDASGDSVTALHGSFAEMLPAFPSDVRRVLVRMASSRPSAIFGDLACAWLLDPSAPLRDGAMDGLFDRLEAGRLAPRSLTRLTVLRSWLTDEALRARLDTLVREAMRTGGQAETAARTWKLHKISASMVDGSGAQNLVATLQSGGSRGVAMVLLKQGFGVKDAYVIPCDSASEQRRILEMISEETGNLPVSKDYLAKAVAFALGEGMQAGHAPAPGLVEVAEVCGLTDLRPIGGSVAELVQTADTDGRIAALSPQARGRLINAGEFWEEGHDILTSWFEDSDAVFAALEGSRTPTALKRALWDCLERRRNHWTRIIARNALLLRDVGAKDADSFTATALALHGGRALKKTPAIEDIFERTLDVWSHGETGHDMAFGGDAGAIPEIETSVLPPGTPHFAPPAVEKPGELATFLRHPKVTEVWLDAYLCAVSAAPEIVMPGDWLEPLLDILGPTLKESELQRFLDLLLLRYNSRLQALRDQAGSNPLPSQASDWPEWSDGFLTAWKTTKTSWPSNKLGAQGKKARKILENMADGSGDPEAFQKRIPDWLREQVRLQAR